MRKHRETLEYQCAKLQQAYLHQWHGAKDDPAKQLLEILIKMLQESENALANRMDYQKAVFLQRKELPRLHAKPFSTRLQFHASNAFTGTTLRKGTRLYVQGEQLYPVRLNEDIGVSHAYISDLYLHEGETAHIEHLDRTTKIPLFMYEGHDEQEFSLSFDVINVVNGMPYGDILVYIEGKQTEDTIALARYFASNHVAWQVSYQDEIIQEVRVVVEEDHLRFYLKQTFTLEDGTLHFKAIVKNTKELPQRMLTNISFSFPDTFANLQSVLVNEVAQNKENFALFDAPLSLFQSCYLRCDKIFTHRDSTMTWEFQMDVKQYTAGSELIEEKEYRTFMRKLPKHQIIYEIFADQVQLEYFNGEWVRIPNVLFQRIDFQTKESKQSFQFHCPSDILPYTAGGEEAIWFRFVLTKAENCYQLPAHHWIPILRRMKFSCTYQNKTYPVQNIGVQANLEKEYLAQSEIGQLPLWKQLPRHKDSLYLCMETQQIFSPFRIFVHMKEDTRIHNDLNWYLLDEDGNEQALNIEDHTKGFSRSGLISIFFPKNMMPSTVFSKKGYWIRIERQSNTPFTNCICAIEEHCVFASACVHEEQEYSLEMDQQSVEIEAEKEVLQVYVKDKDIWELWKLQYSPTTNTKEVYVQGQTLIFQRRSFKNTTIDLASIHVKVCYYQPMPAMQLKENTTVFCAMADPRIASVVTKGLLIQKEDREDDTHLMKRIAHQITSKNTISTTLDIETILPLQFLDIYAVRCFMNQNEDGRKQKGILSIFVLWRDLEVSPFTQHEQNKVVKEYLLQNYPCDVYQIQLQLCIPRMLYAEVILEIVEEDMDMDHTLQEECLSYLHPINGFQHQGWGIGNYPNSKQLLLYLKEQFPSTIFLTCTIRAALLEGNHKIVHRIEDFHYLKSGVVIPQEVSILRREITEYESA